MWQRQGYLHIQVEAIPTFLSKLSLTYSPITLYITRGRCLEQRCQIAKVSWGCVIIDCCNVPHTFNLILPVCNYLATTRHRHAVGKQHKFATIQGCEKAKTCCLATTRYKAFLRITELVHERTEFGLFRRFDVRFRVANLGLGQH